MKDQSKFGKWVECLFEEHKLVRRLLVFWAVTLISWVILRVIPIVNEINAASASMISAIIGILATVTGFYIRSRELDDKNERADDS